MKILKPREVSDRYINFTILENDNEINIFFNKKNLTLVGWQTQDIYQNLSITFISSHTFSFTFNSYLTNLIIPEYKVRSIGFITHPELLIVFKSNGLRHVYTYTSSNFFFQVFLFYILMFQYLKFF